MNTDELVNNVDNWFTYHAPCSPQVSDMKSLRGLGKALALEIATIPDMEISDRLAAIRKVREAIMTANAGIVCYKPPEPPESPPFDLKPVPNSRDINTWWLTPPGPRPTEHSQTTMWDPNTTHTN